MSAKIVAKCCQITNIAAEKFSSQTNVEISNFDLQKRYISQKKAENMYNLDSARKSTILYKKICFFHFFDFRGMVRAGRKFSMSSFLKFSKKKFKK